MNDPETALPCVLVNGQRFNVLHERDEILIIRRSSGSKRYLAKRLGNAQIYGANRAQIVASSPEQAQAVMAAREKAQLSDPIGIATFVLPGRVIRFQIDDGERIERIVIPSPFSDNAMQVIPFKEEVEDKRKV